MRRASRSFTRWYMAVAAAVIVLCAVAAIRFFAGSPSPSYTMRGDESPLLRFVLQHMMSDEGGIYTNLRHDLPEVPDMAANHQVLSESVGLMMDYALRADRQDLFAVQVNFLTRYLLSKEHYISWVYDPDEPDQKVRVTASIDDLKIVDALYAAAEQWDKRSYERLADRIADSLYTQVRNGFLTDYYDWQHDLTATTITSSYIDLEALARLAKRRSEWKEVYTKAGELLETSKLANGFFYKTYDLETQQWLLPESFNMIDVLYAALHRQEHGLDSEATIRFIERKWDRDQAIYNAYDHEGEPADQAISPAVYALAGRLLQHAGKQEAADAVFEALQLLSVRDHESPYYGGFVELTTLEAYSFDHLQALLTETEREN